MVTVADPAFSIAVVRARESERPAAERLFEDPYAALFGPAGAHAAEATERYLGLPFFVDGVRLRTRFIDDAVRLALQSGLRQAVILGAGFDARALRMPEIGAGNAAVYEIDSPAQLERKAAVLTAAGVKVPETVAYVPFEFERADFEEGLTSSLAARGFRAGSGAIFVWEGVIGYIDSAAIDRSLFFMSRAGGPRTRLVYTSHDGAFQPETSEQRMRRTGFGACAEFGLDEIWRRHLPGEPPSYASMSKVGTATV